MATFLAPDCKVCYVAVPKAASTTFEWLVADLAGLETDRFHRTLHLVPTREQTVHAGAQWPRGSWFRRPTADDIAAAGIDSTWFVFSAVREPRARLWSAWQSKFLTRRRRYVDYYGGEPWFPRVPRVLSDVIEDFHRFVTALSDGTTDLMHANAHFRGQAQIVLDGPLDIAHLYGVDDMSRLLADLGQHVRPYGVSVPRLRRDNTTPLTLTADVLADGVDDAIVNLYRDDFDRLAHLLPDEPRLQASSTWTDAALVDVSSRIALHERVEDLSILARDLRRQRAALRA